jgi:hypothetical protein
MQVQNTVAILTCLVDCSPKSYSTWWLSCKLWGMQEVRVVRGAAAAWIGKYYLRQNIQYITCSSGNKLHVTVFIRQYCTKFQWWNVASHCRDTITVALVPVSWALPQSASRCHIQKAGLFPPLHPLTISSSIAPLPLAQESETPCEYQFGRKWPLNNKLRGLSPRENYTDRATAPCRRS